MSLELHKMVKPQDIIAESLKNSLTYAQYRTEVADFAKHHDTSGLIQEANLIDYTMLNDKRMNRWDKTIKISESAQQKISTFEGHVTWLVLTESWCGDAAHIIPVLHKLAELSKGIDLKLVYRDKNNALMHLFLTDGAKSIPKLIMIDNVSGEVLHTFGPRPSEATKLVMDYKLKHGTLSPEFKETLQQWYNKDKGQQTIEDILALLNL